MYLRWDHQLLRPSDGEVDRFREGRVFAVGAGSRPGTPPAGGTAPDAQD